MASQIISSVTGGGKDKDAKRALAEQEARIKAQEEKQRLMEQEQNKKEAASAKARGGRSGAVSLLSGLETGVEPVTPGRRTTLG